MFTNLMENLLEMDSVLKVFCGTCPDEVCCSFIYFNTMEETVTCDNCFQNHDITDLLNRHEVDKTFGLQMLLKKSIPTPKVGTDFIKVDGLSNFRCKLLSPFLTTYGMDKIGNAKLLKELGHSDTIDCGKVLGSRSFMIQEDHMNIKGYGKDQSGSLDYLHEFLSVLQEHHNNEERLIPIHVDGDGHCLVHALSRGLIGRELFWHSLRKNLMDHLQQRLSDYMEFFREFHDKDEWKGIIEEADPDCMFGAGLGNIHIFALSNILKRPIMLIDSLQKINNAGDYAGLFVPALIEPHLCNNKSPLCIAWSGRAHNHFVPLVAVKGRPLPTIPNNFIPGPWGVSEDIANQYLSYNDDGSLTVGNGKLLKNSYAQKLVLAMEDIFLQQHMVSPMLVEDLCRSSYQLAETPGLRPEDITRITSNAVREKRLFRCLVCKALQEVLMSEDDLKPFGKLYEIGVEQHTVLQSDKIYAFLEYNIVCRYNDDHDKLEICKSICRYCGKEETRPVTRHGKILYCNGDNTETLNTTPSSRNCGFKYFWDGKEYDNLPKKFTVTQKWSGEEIQAEVVWFYGDSNLELNSNAEVEAKKIVQFFFPGHCDNKELIGELIRNIHEQCSQLQLFDKMSIDQVAATSCNETSIVTGKPSEAESDDQRNASHMESSPIDVRIPAQESIHLSAYKRKSNGEPTAPVGHTNLTNHESPRQSSDGDSRILIKINMNASETKTLKVRHDITMQALKDEIYNIFGVLPEHQILKHGYPPKLLVSPPDGNSLGLQSGDMIKLNVLPMKSGNREMNSIAILNGIKKIKEALEAPSQEAHSELKQRRIHKLTRDNLVTSQKKSGCKTMWKFVMKKPELFHPGGYFYEQYKLDIGLHSGKHCNFPLIPEHLFCYNSGHDRIDICLEPDGGHCPIDDDIDNVLQRYCKQNESKQSIEDATSSSQLKTESTTDLSKSLSSKVVYLAPGYHTVGDVPAEISSEQKISQRQGLKDLVDEIKAKHTSS